MRVLGIMSGTSIDGVDCAICEAGEGEREEFRLAEFWSAPFPTELQNQLHLAASDRLTTFQVAQLHHDLGRFYASVIPSSVRVDLAGLHGQTVFHNPDSAAPATLQLGEPVYLAKALGSPVISNFRAADLAEGGQGAPLATMFHVKVFGKPGKHVAVNNLGGISNVTSINWPSGQSQPRVLAFDTGPANMLMDMAVRRLTRGKESYDADGARARGATVNTSLLETWLKHPYFFQSPPKSTGRELFGEPFFDQIATSTPNSDSLVATFTEFTARTIALNYSRHLGSMPDEVILCGGGAANPYLCERIEACLREIAPAIQVLDSGKAGWDRQTIEASAFALLAWLSWHHKPGNIPQTTGARRETVLGQVTLP